MHHADSTKTCPSTPRLTDPTAPKATVYAKLSRLPGEIWWAPQDSQLLGRFKKTTEAINAAFLHIFIDLMDARHIKECEALVRKRHPWSQQERNHASALSLT